MTKDEFTKLYKYMTEQFTEVHSRLDSMEERFDSKFNGVYSALDNHSKQLEYLTHEVMALARKVDRHHPL